MMGLPTFWGHVMTLRDDCCTFWNVLSSVVDDVSNYCQAHFVTETDAQIHTHISRRSHYLKNAWAVESYRLFEIWIVSLKLPVTNKIGGPIPLKVVRYFVFHISQIRLWHKNNRCINNVTRICSIGDFSTSKCLCEAKNMPFWCSTRDLSVWLVF